jgi:uncharacterized protein
LKTLQHAFSLPVDAGAWFCVYRRPATGSIEGTVLHLPAFGEEMNKSRAMTARAARALAGRGFGVLQLDLLGCGDSSGDHGDASLHQWIENLEQGLAWLRREVPSAAPWLWCLRAGALLAAPLLRGPARDAPLLLWQPVLSGAQQLNHLVRQKLAGALGPGGERVDAKSLRQRWMEGEAQEIGGYTISPQLARELEQATFDIRAGYHGHVEWFEVSATAAPCISPVAGNKIAALRSIGIDVNAAAVHGPGFWQSVEIEQCEALIAASVTSMTSERMHGALRDAVEL